MGKQSQLIHTTTLFTSEEAPGPVSPNLVQPNSSNLFSINHEIPLSTAPPALTQPQLPVEGEEYLRLEDLEDEDEMNGTEVERGSGVDEYEFDILDSVEQQSKASGILTASLNFTNSIIGAGIIGLPYAISQAGWGLGAGLIILVTFLTSWTVRLLVKNGKLSGKTTYQDLIYYCFGPLGYFSTSVFQFLIAFGGMCAYMIIVGDTIPLVLRRLIPGASDPTNSFLHAITSRGFSITLCTLTVFFPMSLTRDISSLAKTSFVSLVAVIFIVASVVLEGHFVPPQLKGNPPTWNDFFLPDFFQAIGVISFAFVCHHNTFIIFRSLRTPTMDRFSKVTNLSTGIALVFCMIMGLCGYSIFTTKIEGNILNNFPADFLIVNFARFFFAVNMFTTYPIELIVAREVIENICYPGAVISNTKNFLITGFLVLLSYIIAMSTCDLGIVMELGGTIAASALAYVLPPLCYLKLASGPLLSRKKIPHLLVLTFGITVMILGTFLSLNKEGAAKQCT